MPRIYRLVSDYKTPYDSINTAAESSSRCTKMDLCRSMVTVGSPSFFSIENIRNYGFVRAFYLAIVEKAAIVLNNITADQVRLRRHPVFESYVLDQKRIISYNLGMAFAKFYSQNLLGINSLVHVESLKKLNAVSFLAQTGTSRPREPDLVGQTPDGRWHIFEAKGVSGSTKQLSGKIADAKIQVAQVAEIQGKTPATRSACATYIGLDRILTYVCDPPSEADKSIDIDASKFVQAYYAPYLLADRFNQPSRRSILVNNTAFEVIDLESVYGTLSVGVDAAVLDAIRRNDLKVLFGERDAKLQEESPDTPYSIGPDGFYVSYRMQ